jgi:hypothetical protein
VAGEGEGVLTGRNYKGAQRKFWGSLSWFWWINFYRCIPMSKLIKLYPLCGTYSTPYFNKNLGKSFLVEFIICQLYFEDTE